MSYVVTENGIRCEFADCVELCPVDCFHESPNLLMMGPEGFIAFTPCVAEWPADANVADGLLSVVRHRLISLNAELPRMWFITVERGDPVPDAAGWDGKAGKLSLLKR